MITQEMVLSWDPCYTPEQVAETFERSGKTEWTPLDVLDLDIPAADRLWVVLQKDVLDERTLRLCACDFAERVLHLFEAKFPDDKRTRTAIETARRFADGEATREELEAADRAAAGAAGAAGVAWTTWTEWTEWIAEAAASIAAAWAARDVAYVAWLAASWAAAWARAALGVEWIDREGEAQIEIVRGYLS